MELGLSTGIGDNWEGNKKLDKDFFLEFLEIRLSNTNVVTRRIVSSCCNNSYTM